MTTRAAAAAGVSYFADICDIAAQVGVPVPSATDIAARFAATDAIDLPALTADAVMLSAVVGAVGGAADAAFDAHGAMPDAWRGRSADAAEAALAAHARHTQDAVDQIRVVSSTVAAAASALSRVQDGKHATLALLNVDRVAGLPISTITTQDVDANADAIAREIAAAVDLFTRTMDTVDAAVRSILLALTDSFALLTPPTPAPRQAYTAGGSAPVSRSPRQRADAVAAPPAAGRDRPVADVDSTVLVAAISATATITGAALAAASAVGMAAAGGVGSVITHLIDAAMTDHDDGHDTARPTPGVSRDPVPAPTTATPPHAADPGEHERPHGRVPRALVVPVSPSAPETVPETAERHRLDPSPAEPPTPPALAPEGREVPDSDDDPVARSQGVDTHRLTPSGSLPPGARARTDDPAPRGRPDPDDPGGLALAGER